MLLSTAYLPPVSWFALVVQNKGAVLEQCENFEKQSYRNRCLIFGPNGQQPLTVPVERGGKKPIKDLRISYAEDWPTLHWRSMVTAYKNRPFFDILAPDIQAILETRPAFLWDLNLRLIYTIQDWLQDQSALKLTTSFDVPQNNPIDYRYRIHPKQDSVFDDYPPFFQQFSAKHGFQADLSIIDLLFSEGRASWDYLNQL